LDLITDIFKTMHVAAVVHSRLEATMLNRKKRSNMRTAAAWRCMYKAKDIHDGRFLGH
jgi:hypothetical protein